MPFEAREHLTTQASAADTAGVSIISPVLLRRPLVLPPPSLESDFIECLWIRLGAGDCPIRLDVSDRRVVGLELRRRLFLPQLRQDRGRSIEAAIDAVGRWFRYRRKT